MVRKRAAGEGRLEQIGGIAGAGGPPAPIRVWASSMNRMIGVGELCTSSITERSRCSNSPFIDAPACIRPMSSAQSRTPLQRRRHVARRDALGKTLRRRRSCRRPPRR